MIIKTVIGKKRNKLSVITLLITSLQVQQLQFKTIEKMTIITVENNVKNKSFNIRNWNSHSYINLI